MPRNLDTTALRAFAAVAETGGVTRAASMLNLTQSAVSMQLKRLEVALDVTLLDRAGRGVALTAEGEQLLSYARRILALNDEAVDKMTAEEFEGEIRLGVPHDIVPRAIPQVLRAFAAEFPRMKVQLITSWTLDLLEQLEAGACDVILTTEQGKGARGESLVTVPITWVGAPDGAAWRHRPLPLAFEDSCIFKGQVVEALDKAGIPWVNAVSTKSIRAVEAILAADIGVHALLLGTAPEGVAPILHGGVLPELADYNINMYVRRGFDGPAAEGMKQLLRTIYPDVMGSSGSRPSRLNASS